MLRSSESTWLCSRNTSAKRMLTAISSAPIRRIPLPGRKFRASKTGLNRFGDAASNRIAKAISQVMIRFSRLTRARPYRTAAVANNTTANSPPAIRRASILLPGA
jgi:hypothetical protein